MNPTPRLICSLFTATALAACFPPVENAADAGDDDVEVQDSSGLETTSGGDTEPHHDGELSPDIVGLDCSTLNRTCVRGSFDVEDAGCVEVILDGQACDDGNRCTTNDRCDADANCAGTDVDCDDGVECSTEVCSVDAGGCVYDATACPCAADADCADGKPCTSDVCDPTSWTCVNDIAPGNSCNDFDSCTSDDQCDESGGCAGTAKVCDDDNACTADSCDLADGACVFAPLSGTACDDGDDCSVGDGCIHGTCEPGRLASFVETFPAYYGPFARLSLGALPLEDGSYLMLERRVYTGPEHGGFNGIFWASLTAAGASTVPPGQAFNGYDIAGITYEQYFSATHASVERSGDDVYVLTNQSYLGRSMLNGLAAGWGYVPPYDGHQGGPRATGLAQQNGTPVLCGDTASVDGGTRLWLGWVDATDGSIASSVEPEGGEGVRGVAIQAIASGFIVAGLVDGSDGDDLWVGRLDEAGAIQWQKTYPAPLDQTPVTIVPTTTAINVVARTASPVDGTERAWIVRLDYAGEPLGETIPSDAEFHVADAVDTPDGGLLVVGRRPKDMEWFKQAHVLWLDGDGTLVSEHDGPDTNNGYTSVRRTETGYILTGSSGDLYYDSAGVLEVTDFELNTPCDPTP